MPLTVTATGLRVGDVLLVWRRASADSNSSRVLRLLTLAIGYISAV